MKVFQFFLFFCLILIGCNNRQDLSRHQVFKLNLNAGLSSLDPAFSKDQSTMWMCNQLYNGLLQLDDELNVIPSISKHYEISDDGLVYTFYLRDDVYFHDHPIFNSGKGRRVVADDFVYSFNRLIDNSIASTGAWLFNGRVRDSIPFEAKDDTTFIIHLKNPFRPLSSILTLQYCSVVPKEIVERYQKDFRKIAIGTGPFQLVKWQENNALVLKRNKNYFETDSAGNPLPYIDGVKVSFLNDRAVEFLQFLQGGLDFVSGIDKSFIDKVLNSKGELKDELKGQVKMIRGPYMNTEYLGFSMDKVKNQALKNKLVRQAINYAIDREKMILYLRNGIGIPAHYGIVPQGVNGFNENVKGYSYQPKLARQLLEKAGYPDGKGMKPIVLSSNPNYQDLTEFIAKSLEEIGIKVEIQLSPGSFLREAMAKNDVDFFRASWIGDYPDVENFLALFYGPNSAPPNYTRYHNQKYDSLYVKSMQSDNDKSSKLYLEMENIMMEDAPIVPLFYDELIRFIGPNISYMPSNAMNMLVLKSVKMN
ncbi:MAG: ABC transporter substrate-binding protein [Chitinophagales bacterium]|nr:ABC transporter substrate-binding protein [Chitinophagales bacterium]MCZ2394662.1 ABC transporter substrate-binding protein [Chitinophagales bacterium]